MNNAPQITKREVDEAIAYISLSAVQRILRKLNLPFSYDKLEIVEKITIFVKNARLDWSAFLHEVRLLEECGSKIIYLKDVKDLSLLQNTEKLTQILHNGLDKPKSRNLETIRLPQKNCVNYIQITDNEARVKFSETHTKIKADFKSLDFNTKTLSFNEEKRTNIIVFSVNRKNGRAIIYMDTPLTEHIHVNLNDTPSDEEYISFYHKLFDRLFNQPHTPHLNPKVKDLIRKCHSQLKNEKVPVCYPTMWVDQNNYDSRTTSRNQNLLNDPTYLERLNDLKNGIIPENIWFNYCAKAENSELAQDIKVEITLLEARLNIPAETPESEVAYVISSVR